MELSDEEIRHLRQRFGDGVRITGRMPTVRELSADGSWLERIAGTVGLEKWMWNSRRGLLLAVIVVPPAIHGFMDFWKPVVTTGIELASPYLEVLGRTAVDLEQRLIAFTPEPSVTRLEPLNDRAIIAPAAGRAIKMLEGLQEIDATIYRLVSRRTDPLDGRLLSNLPGRWHSRGTPILYSSNSVLAAIGEWRRMMPSMFMPPDFLNTMVLHEIRVAGIAEILPPDVVAAVMNDDREVTRMIGDDWLKRGETGLLVAPSRVDPASRTILVNLGVADRLDMRIVRSMPLGGALA